jgi:hypothetical protein
MTYHWFTSRFKKNRKHFDNTANSGHREPLDHPELARMTMRELADLPMPNYALDARTCDVRIIQPRINPSVTICR